MRVLTAEEMREVDRRAIEDLGIPSLVLMENAAIGVVDALAERYPNARDVAIFCGPGNNGGDGLAVARHLDARGYRVAVYVVLRDSEPKGDGGVQLGILQRSSLTVGEIRAETDLAPALAACQSCDVWLDALFGTGLSRPLEGHFASLLEALSELPVPCVAVDLPSGLDASQAEPIGPHARAELTVTFAAPKLAHIFAPAAEAAGEVIVADLGIPPWVVPEAPGQLHLSTAEDLAVGLISRAQDAHKGTYGHLLLVAGAPGKAGAAILAARAAVRGGAGLVSVAVPSSILGLVDAGSLESMTLALPSDGEGVLDATAAEVVLEAASGKTALALGPGLGTARGSVDSVRQVVESSELPLVLDADGLNAYAGHLGALAQRRAPTILTPHPGEMGRLLETSSADVQSDRLGAARRAAELSGAVVILKGHQSLIADADGEVWINPTGNPGMATGGSGDVLTGLVAALLAQGHDAMAAARLGAWLHGVAGDLVAAEASVESLRALEICEALGAAFAELHAS